jgi:hypothetical protein
LIVIGIIPQYPEHSQNTDAWIQNKVNATLLFHRSVNADRTTKFDNDVNSAKGINNRMTIT